MQFFFRSIKKWLLLSLLGLTVFATYYYDLPHYLSFAVFKKYQIFAQAWTVHHYLFAVMIYLFFFIILVACAIPCATFLTIVGGFLFGMSGFMYALASTVTGGLILFLAVRTSIGNYFAKHATGKIKMIEEGCKKNAFHYLLLLRLIPIFPCGLCNIAAGLLNIPIKTFLSATTLGIFPATFIYILIGHGFDQFFRENQTFHFSILLTPSLLLPLSGLSLISLLPVYLKHVNFK